MVRVTHNNNEIASFFHNTYAGEEYSIDTYPGIMMSKSIPEYLEDFPPSYATPLADFDISSFDRKVFTKTARKEFYIVFSVSRDVPCFVFQLGEDGFPVDSRKIMTLYENPADIVIENYARTI